MKPAHTLLTVLPLVPLVKADAASYCVGTRMRLTFALLATLLLPLTPLYAADAPKTPRPMLLAAYYCWYHAPTHAVEPWLHWTYPASKSNVVALKRSARGNRRWRRPHVHW